jgi:hypothetical protein
MYLVDPLKSSHKLRSQCSAAGFSSKTRRANHTPLHGTTWEQPRHSGATEKDQSTGSRRVISTSGISVGNFFHLQVV